MQKYLVLVGFLGLLALVGCESTLHLQPGKQLIRRAPQFRGNQLVREEALRTGIKTQANDQLFGYRLKMQVHYLGISLTRDSSLGMKLYRRIDRKRTAETSLANWLKNKIGQAPRTVDADQLLADAANLEALYFANGFLDAKVTPRLEPSKKNPRVVDVVFEINEGPPYQISSVVYAGNQELVNLANQFSNETLLRLGRRYNHENLTNERIRLANVFRNFGYLRVDPSQISYVADTLSQALPDSLQRRNRRRRIKLPTAARPLALEIILPDSADVYHLKEVRATLHRGNSGDTTRNMLFDLRHMSPEVRKAYGVNTKWLSPDQDVHFFTTPEEARRNKLSVIARRIRLNPGDRYSLLEQRRTIERLNAMGIFRSSFVTFRETDPDNHGLTADVDLQLLRKYDMRVGAEMFQSQNQSLNGSNIPGFGATFSLRDRNFFGGAEQFIASLNGTVSFYRSPQTNQVEPLYQYAGRLNVVMPSFWLVETPRRNMLEFRPTTSFALTLGQERRVEFTRTSVGGEWIYTWFNIPQSDRAQMTFTPLSVLWVETKNLDTTAFGNFFDPLPEQVKFFILRDLEPRLLSRGTYSYSYSGHYGDRRRPLSWFVRPTIEIGGNLPWLLDLLSSDGRADDNLLAGQYVYGQYFKIANELKLFRPVGLRSDLVTRLFLGYSKGWLNNPGVPFQYRFFTGGVSTNRGWLSNTLGPGTFSNSENGVSSLLPIGGEIALEFNLEYRFPLAGDFKGALFFDAGNVWFNAESAPGNPQAVLSRETLQLGLSGGFGVRWDLEFLVLRLDIGQQLYAPDLRRWVLQKGFQDIGSTRMQYNFGIGYPF